MLFAKQNDNDQKGGESIDMVKTIDAKTGWQLINLKELIEFRNLFFFLAWRDIKVLYAQTILGFMWAILQPLIQIVIFTIIFGKVAKISTDGVPYVVFSSLALIPWTYMSQAVTSSSQSLVQGQNMLGKIYFPRLIFPLAPIVSKLVDFGISTIIIFIIMVYYRILPTWNILLIPLFIGLMAGTSAGIGLWLSAMAIRFRDVKLAMPLAIRMMMYTAPIVYPISSIPEKYRLFYSLNPIVGVIEGFRACFLGTAFHWQYIYPSFISASVLLIIGAFYFKSIEHIFVDVI